MAIKEIKGDKYDKDVKIFCYYETFFWVGKERRERGRGKRRRKRRMRFALKNFVKLIGLQM